MTLQQQLKAVDEITTKVYCPICTHIVEATVTHARKKDVVKPGQHCGHCHSSIDAGYVLQWNRAA